MAFSEQKIPSGFKQTDVGVIPEEWDVAPLFEICGFGGGTTPPRSQHDRYFVGGSNNWIKTTDLNNSLIGLSEEQITEVALSETGLKKHPVGTVLVAMYGGFNQIGRTGLITKPSAINQALVAVKPKPKKLNSYYLLSELNYNVDYWKGVASSSRKDPNITSNDVKNYKIALPSVEEQTAITNALSDVDALLTELEKLIAKKQAIKTATMQQLLTGKTRLPQFATYTEGEKQGQPKGTKPSELGEIPEDWDIVDLASVIEKFVGGGTPSRSVKEYWGKEIPWVTVKDFSSFSPYKAQESITIKGLTNSASNLIPSGTLITSTRMALGKAVIYKVDVAINQDLKALFCKNNLDSKFLFFWFESNASRIDDLGSGSTVKGISLSDLRAISFLLPTKNEQSAIATILSDMDNEIQTLEQRLAKTRQIKKGMMQELLTGRTRLPFDQE